MVSVSVTELYFALQLSLGYMIKDIVKFMIVFIIIVMAFATCLYTLYHHYAGLQRIDNGEVTTQVKAFSSSVSPAWRYIYCSVVIEAWLHSHARTHTHAQTHEHTRTFAHTHARTHNHTHAQSHNRTPQTHTHARAHTHTYYYYYNAFITRHDTSGLKTCSEALTNIQYRIV